MSAQLETRAIPHQPKLLRLADVRAEMAKLYRAARAGALDVSEATKLVYILKEIRCCIETQKVDLIEARMNEIAERAVANATERDIEHRESSPPLQ